MICPPCRVAGDYNTDANRARIPEVIRDLQQKAARMHKQCVAPATCPCHHTVGVVTAQEGRT